MSNLEIIDPKLDSRWDDFVDKHPLGWISHLSGWNKILETTFKHLKGYYLVISKNNEIEAGLAIFEVRSWLTGNRLVSIPFATLCDPLVGTNEEMTTLMRATIQLANKLNIPYIEIRTTHSEPFKDSKLNFKSEYFYKHHYFDLNQSPEELEKKYHRTCVRQRIIRALKSDIIIETSRSEYDLEQFYKLYLMTRKRLNLPMEPYMFFKEMWHTLFPKRYIKVLIAKYNSQPIAGLLLLQYKNRVSAESAVLNKNFSHLSPLHLLFSEAIKSAHKEGFAIFDFGRTSPLNQSLMKFKKHWGTTIKDLPILYYPANRARMVSMKERSLGYHLVKGFCRISPTALVNNVSVYIYDHMS